jgi:hypothetical protein
MAKWLIDYDSTLCDTQAEYIKRMNERFGTQYTKDNFATWSAPLEVRPEHYKWLWSEECFLNEDFQRTPPPVEGAIEGFKALLNAGHDAMIVSDRPASLFEVTRDWLDRQGLEFVRLYFSRHKHSLNGQTEGLTKIQVAWYNKLTHVVEDAPHHAKAFSAKPYMERIYLLDKPYNQGIEHEKITRVDTWEDIVRGVT